MIDETFSKKVACVAFTETYMDYKLTKEEIRFLKEVIHASNIENIPL